MKKLVKEILKLASLNPPTPMTSAPQTTLPSALLSERLRGKKADQWFAFFYLEGLHFENLTLLSIFIAFSFNAQLSIERKKFIQKKSRWILPKNSKLSTTLAVKLTKDFKDDASKSYAISYWIAKKVKYDYKAFLTNTLSRHSSKEVLKRRRALCSEYADLFNEMAEAAGLKSETINGYVHPFDFFPGDTLYRAEHAWSTVKINNQWELMDITWGAGYVEEKKQLIKKFKLDE